MKYPSLIFLMTFFALLACSDIRFITSKTDGDDLPQFHQGKEILKIDNVRIQEGYLESLGNVNPRIKAQLKSPLARKQVLDSLVEQELMYQESKRRGIDQKPLVREKMALYKRIIVAQSLLEEEIEKKSHDYYEQKKEAEFTKVKFSHIQIDFKKAEKAEPSEKADSKAGVGKKVDIKATTESKPETKPADALTKPATDDAEFTEAEKQEASKKAQDIRARLVAGEDFETLVKELSDDKISKQKGGDMGFVSKNDKRLERRGFEKINEVIFQLKNGDFSEPIESKKGYHIVKVTSEPTVTPFEEADKIIRFQIQKDVKDSLIEELKKKSNVVIVDEPKPAALPTGPQAAPSAPEGAPPQDTTQGPQTPSQTPPPADQPAPVPAQPETPPPSPSPPPTPEAPPSTPPPKL